MRDIGDDRGYRDRRFGEPVHPDRAVLLEQHCDPEDRQREEEERHQRDAVVEAAVLAQCRDKHLQMKHVTGQAPLFG